MLAAVLISGALLMPRLVPGDWWAFAATPAPTPPPSTAAMSSAAVSPTVSVGPGPSPTAKASKAARPAVPDLDKLPALPGAVPSHGDGGMAFAAGTGPVLGTSGTLRRFRIAVERDTGEDLDAFTAQVEQTLGDPRSWPGSGLRLQRVPKGADSEFTVYLATRDTAQEMCVAGGVNLVVGGVPYTSCRTTGRVVINLDRWRLSAKPYRAAKVPLAVYRAYVVNHEVGHELGHHHEGCPRQGAPAPVMVQQTLTLRGCTPYPWPRRGGKRYAGPAR
jgi:hypothetical protein